MTLQVKCSNRCPSRVRHSRTHQPHSRRPYFCRTLYVLNEFRLTPAVWEFLLWNYRQSLFLRNKRMAFLIFFGQHQSILFCLLFLFSVSFALLGSSHWPRFPPLAVQLKQPLMVTWHSCAEADLDPSEGMLGQADGCN